MIVVDTNVLAYLLIPGNRTATAEAVFERDPEWRAPALWRHELLNTLSLYVRKSLLSIDQAELLEQRASEVIRSQLQPEPRRVLQLSMNSGCSGYDCEFVAAVEQWGLPLVTADQKVLDAFPKLAVSMNDFLASK